MADSEPRSGPYIGPETSLPETTIKAIILGVLLSALLAGANAYLGLKVGMTVSASIPAAVISMAVLRLFRTHNILENNIVQTAASAGESLAAGVIFTLPALIMLGYWESFEFLPMVAIALFGGCLGVMFTIPLRRALILEARLQFPEGVATGEVLKAGEEGGKGALLIAVAGLAGAALKLCQTGFKAVAGKIHFSAQAGSANFAMGTELTGALLAVGYIVGLNIAVLVFAGGLISWLFGIPLYTALADPATVAEITGGAGGYAAAEEIWSARIRYMGVGAMATGGLWALVSLVKPIRDGIRSSLEAVKRAREEGTDDVPRTERDTPINIVMIGTLVLAIPIFVIFWFVVDADRLGIGAGHQIGTVVVGVLFALIAGFLFSSVAGYMAGLVGSSNNPISGVTIATVLSFSLLLLLILGSVIDFQVDQSKAVVAAAVAILVGGVVCCAAAIAGDNMQDLKAGHIVGATPYKQQIMQIVGVVAAAIVIAPVLQLLFEAYGLGDVFPREGMDPKEALKAPQATLMSSVAIGVLLRDLPWGMIAIGAVIAVAIIIADEVLKARQSTFRAPVLAVAVGIYLPIELSVPIFIGGLIAYAAGRSLAGRSKEDRASAGRRGLLFASGLITGEALVGILLAIPFAAAQSNEVLALPLYQIGEIFTALGAGELGALDLSSVWPMVGQVLGVAAFVGFCLWLYKVASKPE